MTYTLHYRSSVDVEQLGVGECTVRRAKGADKRWWDLWWFAYRETDGLPEAFVVPVSPGGRYAEDGPGGRTWGLTRTASGVWQVAPSINVLNVEDSRRAVAGLAPTGVSLWHQTPAIVGVLETDAWARGEAP